MDKRAYTDIFSGLAYKADGSALDVSALLEALLAAAAATAGWAPVQVDNVTANSSNKVIPVPAATRWQPLTVYVELSTTATVGNRQLAVEFRDASDNVIASAKSAVVQAENVSARGYVFALGVDRLWAVMGGNHVTTPLPVTILPAGYDVHVFDAAAIDAAADDMTVRILALAWST